MGIATGICEIDEKKNIRRLERDWIGQGWGFKDEEAFNNRADDPCYVPELSDEVYTRNDFLKLCNDQIEIAELIFCLVDWQSPDALLNEEFLEGELIRCCMCGRIMKGYQTDLCPYCGTGNCIE